MKKVTELEHFVNEHAINGDGKICAIAASIEANKIGYCKKWDGIVAPANMQKTNNTF